MVRPSESDNEESSPESLKKHNKTNIGKKKNNVDSNKGKINISRNTPTKPEKKPWQITGKIRKPSEVTSSKPKKPEYMKTGSYFYFKIKPEVDSKVDALILKLYESIMEAVPGLCGGNSDTSIYTGYSGIALLNYFLFKKTRDKVYFDTAKGLVSKALKSLKGRRISFLNGDAGPLALAAIFSVLEQRNEEADDYIHRLIELGDTADSNAPDEILYGRAGYLYALLFVEQETKPLIPDKVLRKTVEKIIQSGTKEAARRKSVVPLYYEWHDKIYLGAAHGYAGILYMLLNASRHMSEYEKENLVKPTLEWLINTKFQSGNFPSSIGSMTDRLIQWCHGAPGFTHLLSLASQVYKNPRYRELALECGDAVWERGLLKKGYSICHGVSGNAYTFLHLYQMTKDIKHLYRAASFVDWCTRYPANEGMRPDRPFSLFEGKAGLLYFLADAKDPLRALFPCYELKSSG